MIVVVYQKALVPAFSTIFLLQNNLCKFNKTPTNSKCYFVVKDWFQTLVLKISNKNKSFFYEEFNQFAFAKTNLSLDLYFII